MPLVELQVEQLAVLLRAVLLLAVRLVVLRVVQAGTLVGPRGVKMAWALHQNYCAQHDASRALSSR